MTRSWILLGVLIAAALVYLAAYAWTSLERTPNPNLASKEHSTPQAGGDAHPRHNSEEGNDGEPGLYGDVAGNGGDPVRESPLNRDRGKRGDASAMPARAQARPSARQLEQERREGMRLQFLEVSDRVTAIETLDLALKRLQSTVDPLEIAILARRLEAEAPGSYRAEVHSAVRNALLWAEEVPIDQRKDMSPLFELLEDYGAEAVGDLKRHMSDWWEYSLMSLARLEGGAGIASLAAKAGDPGVPVRFKPTLPPQMLAQAAADYPEAGDALVDLARSGQIPDRAWDEIGAALQGKHWVFPRELIDGSSPDTPSREGSSLRGSEYRNVFYEEKLVSRGWSDEQTVRQVALIDRLLEAPDSQVAVEELRMARALLP